MTSKPSEPNEDYLERICELLEKKSYARVSDVAEELGVKPASVTKMLQKLEIDGYVIRESYRGFSLTEAGKIIGDKVHKRHEILFEFLTLIGVSKKVAESDVDGLEHHLSDESVEKLKKVIEKLKSD